MATMARSPSTYIDLTADTQADSEEAGPSNWQARARDWRVQPPQGGSRLVLPGGPSRTSASTGRPTSRTQTPLHSDPIEVSSGEEDDDIMFVGVGAAPPRPTPPRPRQRSVEYLAPAPFSNHLLIRDMPVPGALAGPARRHQDLLMARRANLDARREIQAVEAELHRRELQEQRRLEQQMIDPTFGPPIAWLNRFLDIFGPAGPPAELNAGMGGDARIPSKFTTELTHPKAPPKPFSKDIIEPPLEVETYEISKHRVTGPLPSTTPICAGCDRSLILGEAGDKRIWALPCGHVIDGHCVMRLAGTADAVNDNAPETSEAPRKAARKGKQKASPRSNKAKQAPPPAPLTFECPVSDCHHDCTTASGEQNSARQLFI